jgi:hypothetical protein
MNPHTPDQRRRRGSVLTEQAFVLAAIVGIVLVAVARLGSETNLVFDQLSKTFPRLSKSSAGRQPAAKRGNRAPSTRTAMAGGKAAPAAAAVPASTGATKKMAGGQARSGSGGGGLPQAKQKPKRKPTTTVSWGVTSTSSGSGLMALFVGSR